MPDGITWSTEEVGIEDFQRFIEEAGVRVTDMREPLEDTRDLIIGGMAEQFATEGARSGGWVPLEEDYQLWKDRRAQEWMLQLDPLYLHDDPGTPEEQKMKEVLLDPIEWDIGFSEATYSPNSTRAGWHQEGVPFRRRGGELPARPILVITEEDYAAIDQYFWDWLDKILETS